MPIYTPDGTLLHVVTDAYLERAIARGEVVEADGRYVIAAVGLNPLTPTQKRARWLARQKGTRT